MPRYRTAVFQNLFSLPSVWTLGESRPGKRTMMTLSSLFRLGGGSILSLHAVVCLILLVSSLWNCWFKLGARVHSGVCSLDSVWLRDSRHGSRSSRVTTVSLLECLKRPRSTNARKRARAQIRFLLRAVSMLDVCEVTTTRLRASGCLSTVFFILSLSPVACFLSTRQKCN